jgi:subtilisin family serine protease
VNNNPAQTQGEPIQYFLPGRIILHFEHPDGLTQTQLAKDIGDFFKQEDLDRPWKSQLAPPKPEAILTFPLKDDKGLVLSIVPVLLRDKKASQKDLIKLLTTIDAEISKGPLYISGNVTLNSVAPNWLIGSAPHGPHPPSPGSWPVDADTPKEADWNFQLKDKQKLSPLLFAKEQGAQIHVAIIDTAPAAIHLDEAYKRWRSSHQLVDRLLGPNRKLHVHTGIYADLELMDYSLVGHRYLMRDHGLFVAGIINSIAPEATLHLVKAFTPYGSGSTETIAQALLYVLQNLEIGRPLIVNCSFGLSIDDGPDFPVELRDRDMSRSLREIFNRLANEKDVIVVAAAGNDARPNSRPSARFPAAFEKVIGVGALPKGFPLTNGRYQAASYSNLADDPLCARIGLDTPRL